MRLRLRKTGVRPWAREGTDQRGLRGKLPQQLLAVAEAEVERIVAGRHGGAEEREATAGNDARPLPCISWCDILDVLPAGKIGAEHG